MTTIQRTCWWVKEKKQMAFVFITITMMLQLDIKGCVGCVESERLGLLQLKSYLIDVLKGKEEGIQKRWGDDPSSDWPKEGILKSWSDDDSTSDCCLWERVQCSDAVVGYIVDLSLNQIMPDAWRWGTPWPLNLSLLHSFPQLITLDLSSNWFSNLFDPIHGYTSFQRLEKLRTLDFSRNALNNSILPFLSVARSLRTLNLAENILKGVFPPNELANMTELRLLYLSSNEFSFFSGHGYNLRELEVLDLSDNSISDIDAGDGLRMTKLVTLDLTYNKFSDNVRLKGLQNFVELKNLSLAYNKLNHSRSIQVLKDMLKLQKLDLTGNNFADLESLGVVFPPSLLLLNLKDNQLSLNHKGYSKICRLMNLRELVLRGNALTSIPNCLDNLRHLRTLDLSNNQLNGNLSSFVSGLPSALEFLSLLDNNFNGPFLFNSLVNQTRLTVFQLSSKVGMIQDRTETLWVPSFQLKMLTLQNFVLGSRIPGFLVHQHDLRFIDLSNNHLTGAFPTWLVQNNTRLRTILLRRNSLKKLPLPKLVHGLEFLDISSNMIYDSIQEDIGIVFPRLMYMNISSNHFHGAIPSSMGEMQSLQIMDMSSNDLNGKLPETVLGGCFSLRFLLLSNNRFQGIILPEHANLTALEWLALDGNNFNGSLGIALLKSKNLYILDISNNRISGALPLWIGRMPILGYLYMGGNQLKGSFPRQLQNLPYLTVLDISHNSLSGSIPRNLEFPLLRELRLQSNGFTGSDLRNAFGARRLEILDLRNNNLSGKILNDMSSTLQILLLRNNSLQGHIPEKICQLSRLRLLDLSHNTFRGVIPSCLANMSFGTKRYDNIVSADMSSLSIEIPFFQNWSYASAFDLDDDLQDGDQSTPTTMVDFSTKSRYEVYQGNILLYMYGLDLSSNQLSGEIPVEIGDLKNIKSLNLSSNHLTGSIPDSISKLKELESLDLSYNKLVESIPPQLANLNSLGYFNVSHNNLSGEIPFRGHLGSFDEKSYIGNPHLCGLPTNISCNFSRAPEPTGAKEEEEEGDDVIDMVWFYWTCGAVYISTLLALTTFLCIDSRWSQEWFYWVDLFIYHLHRFKGRFFGN